MPNHSRRQKRLECKWPCNSSSICFHTQFVASVWFYLEAFMFWVRRWICFFYCFVVGLAFTSAQALLAQELSLDSLGLEQPSATTKLNLDDLGTSGTHSGSQRVAAIAPQRWSDNLRFATDLSIRSVYDGRSGDFGVLLFAGIDLHKVFTDDEGDWGTLIAQNYLVYNENVHTVSRFDQGFDLEYRIFNFNFTRFGKGKTNFRIGHFEIPFGLEQVINTNGTLRQYLHEQNLGVKTDWGITFNGVREEIEYELGLSRGSGNNWRRRNDPYIIAGRVGTSRDNPITLGLSGLHGEVLNRKTGGGTTRRSRLAGDFIFTDERFIWLGEVSVGFEDDNRAYSALWEVDWTDPEESFLAYNQLSVRGFGDLLRWDNELRNSFGIRWTPNTKCAASGQVTHFFDALAGAGRGTTLELQLRYRF